MPHENDSTDRKQRIIERTRQLILMRETGPKGRAWHAARVRLIWRLHEELRRLSTEPGAGERTERKENEIEGAGTIDMEPRAC
jgi:hypothetical protein